MMKWNVVSGAVVGLVFLVAWCVPSFGADKPVAGKKPLVKEATKGELPAETKGKKIQVRVKGGEARALGEGAGKVVPPLEPEQIRRLAEFMKQRARMAEKWQERRMELEKMFRKLQEKQERGEKLNDDERRMLERLKALRMNPGLARVRPFMYGRRLPERPEFLAVDFERLNPIDRSYFEVAGVLYKMSRTKEIPAQFQKVIDTSPDPLAKDYAHFCLATFYRLEEGDMDKALNEYKKVQDGLKRKAQWEIVRTYLDKGDAQAASRHIDEMLKEARSSEEKIDILYSMAELCQEREDLEGALTYLRRVPEVVTYKDLKAEENMRRSRGRSSRTDDQASKRRYLRALILKYRAAGELEKAEQVEQKLKALEERMLDARRAAAQDVRENTRRARR